MVYWEGRTFYGFGMGAASYLAGRRFCRPKRLGAYRAWVEQLAADADAHGAQLPGGHLPLESDDDRLLDTIMLRLRLSDGLDLVQLAADHPQGRQAAAAVMTALQPHIKAGRVIVDESGDSSKKLTGTVRLADPEGFVLSNDIISDVFAALDITRQPELEQELAAEEREVRERLREQ